VTGWGGSPCRGGAGQAEPDALGRRLSSCAAMAGALAERAPSPPRATANIINDLVVQALISRPGSGNLATSSRRVTIRFAYASFLSSECKANARLYSSQWASAGPVSQKGSLRFRRGVFMPGNAYLRCRSPAPSCRHLAALIADPRDRSHITHTVADLLRARMLAISCGYPGWQRLRSATVRSGLQTCLRSVARQRVGPLLATNYLALGDTIAVRDHLPHLCPGRCLVPELPEPPPARSRHDKPCSEFSTTGRSAPLPAAFKLY